MKRINALWKKAFLFVCSWCISTLAMAQTVPVGLLQGMDDYFRRQQLLGQDSLAHSFLIRPLYMTSLSQEGMNQDGIALQKVLVQQDVSNMSFKVSALPLVWKQQVNSHHPYSLNDGALIPSKGYSTLLSTGVLMEFGPLFIQLRPEVVFAQNKSYPTLKDFDQPATLLSAYNAFMRNIDVPERFGDGTYSQVDWGQSAIGLQQWGIALTLSHENLWWGPGRHHTLLMSNNAPGFWQVRFNSTKPLTTGIGSFEWQLVSGRLEGSGIDYFDGSRSYAKNSNWRYFNGLTLSYQPKWIPGLYLGFDRAFHLYHDKLGKGLTDYLPVFSFLLKSSFAQDSHSNTEDAKDRDQKTSVFARWVFPESHAEVYFQYGREDHAWDLRDLFIEPEHSRAYLLGVRKLFPFGIRPNEFMHVGIEAIQLDPSSSRRVRSMGYWYTNSSVQQGYTHKGKYLGNGYGPDNVQTLDVAWMSGFKKIGLLFERRVHNNELYLRTHSATMDSRKRWVDLNLLGQVDWNFKNLLINAQAGVVRALNYQYYLPTPPNGEYWYGPKNDVNNFNLKLGLLYQW
jgi:hypothetical protein